MDVSRRVANVTRQNIPSAAGLFNINVRPASLQPLLDMHLLELAGDSLVVDGHVLVVDGHVLVNTQNDPEEHRAQRIGEYTHEAVEAILTHLVHADTERTANMTRPTIGDTFEVLRKFSGGRND